MPGYKEQRADWDFNETDTGMTGTRSFIEITGGPDDLPIIHSPFDDTPEHAYCILRSINSKQYGVEGGVNKRRFVCNYNSTGAGQQALPHDPGQRHFQGGAEALSIPPSKDGSDGWKWIDDTIDTDTDIYKVIPTGSFSQSIQLVGDASRDKWFSTLFIPTVGTINDAVFNNFRIGSVYFSGCTGSAQYDKWGHRIWIMECQFAWKMIKGTTYGMSGLNLVPTPIVKDDWLYIFRPGIGLWDKPKDKAGGYLYEHGSHKAVVAQSQTL